jgi:hypothetical protein
MGHPGDIRKMTYRDVPDLKKFVDGRKGAVIFFSTKGTRSCADMSGGGDYDGDTFLIIYGNNVVVQSFKESVPYNYGGSSSSSPKPPYVGDPNLDVIKSLLKPSNIGIYANHRKACKYNIVISSSSLLLLFSSS